MHIAGDLVATPANYEMVTSFLFRSVVQQSKTWKTACKQTESRQDLLGRCILEGKAFLTVLWTCDYIMATKIHRDWKYNRPCEAFTKAMHDTVCPC